MKGKMKPVIRGTASALAISMITSVGVMAAPANTEIENSKWAYKAVADVTTQVNIRANASTDSAIVGYLPKAASADVIERGEEWSHVISDGVEGYIKNEYLAYGEEAKALASVYGTHGVEISWDDVTMFSEPDACSSIVGKANGGSEYELLSDEGLWYSVMTSNGNVAYVPAEDVKETIILDKAISVQPEAGTQTAAAADATYTDSNSYETEQSTTEPAYSEPTTEAAADTTTYETESYETEASTESYQEETTAETAAPETSAPETEAPAADTSEPTSEETVTTATSSDVSLLAALIFCEAGNQPREGKVAVGAVVMNRIASSSYPGTISDVIYQSGQFHPAMTGWLGQVIASGAPQDCYEAAQAALNGENPVPGALYFNNSAGKGTKIGDHYFY